MSNVKSPKPKVKLVQLHDLKFRPMISAAKIKRRIREIGSALSQDFEGKKPVFIPILNGAFMFAADLVREFRGDCELAFVQLKSYAGTGSTGEVRVVLDIERAKIEGRHLILVEDILDSGRTLHHFLQHLAAQNPASISTVVLLRKPAAVQFPIEVRQLGFDIENKFVVGYGLDYDDLGRNLPSIFVLSE